jgi:propionyl-CoA synthetase
VLVFKAGVERLAGEIEDEVVPLGAGASTRPRASRQRALSAACLKTRSGKILRGTIRKITDREDYPMPATIDEPAVLGEIQDAFERTG